MYIIPLFIVCAAPLVSGYMMIREIIHQERKENDGRFEEEENGHE